MCGYFKYLNFRKRYWKLAYWN